MAKKKAQIFECQHCGFQSSKWLGKCSNCGAWESFLELKTEQIEVLKTTSSPLSTTKVTPITEVQEEEFVRFSSGESELDIVLGEESCLGECI